MIVICTHTLQILQGKDGAEIVRTLCIAQCATVVRILVGPDTTLWEPLKCPFQMSFSHFAD